MRLQILMCFLNCNSLLTINYHSIIRPLNEVSTFSGLRSRPMLGLLYWILLTLEVSTENPVPECLIHNALRFTSQLKVKITFICMFSFISSKLLWERRHVLLFLFLRQRKCIIWGDELTCQGHSANNLCVKAWSQAFGLLHQCFPVSHGFSPSRTSGQS